MTSGRETELDVELLTLYKSHAGANSLLYTKHLYFCKIWGSSTLKKYAGTSVFFQVR